MLAGREIHQCSVVILPWAHSGICNEISFDSRYSAVCVEFSGVRFLGLYNCRAVSYGCAEMEHKYTSSGCVACPKGELARNKVLETSSSIHDFQIAKHAVIATKDIMLLRPQHRAPNAHLNMAAPAQLFPSLPKVLPHNQNAISPAAAALTRLVPLQ